MVLDGGGLVMSTNVCVCARIHPCDTLLRVQVWKRWRVRAAGRARMCETDAEGRRKSSEDAGCTAVSDSTD